MLNFIKYFLTRFLSRGCGCSEIKQEFNRVAAGVDLKDDENSWVWLMIGDIKDAYSVI
jgi:hypothetical protein